MIVSNLAIAYFPARVETTSDAHAVISNMFQLNAYIQRYGNVSIEYDNKNTLWKVPAFAGKIQQYSEAKARDCARFGCE